MGIHNSSHLSTEWRVKNHINMKAFMTICALLAGSASEDPQLIQNLVAFKQQTDIPLIPYQVASLPLNPISYTNLFDYRMDPATYTIGYPTLINQGLIKREAEPETPYAYESKVENPEDGSKYQFDVRVDKDGNGRSHQRVEQQDNTPVARDGYLMDQRMIEQNRMDRMRMDQMKQQVIEKNLQGLRQMDQALKEQNRLDQRLSYQNQMDQRQMMSQNQLDQNRMDQKIIAQNQMDQTRMGQRMGNQMMRNQDQMDSRMYSMVDQREMGMMNQRMLDNNMRHIDQHRINQDQHRINQDQHRISQRLRDNVMERNQMQSHRMIKREAGPNFAYTISTGHPSEQSRHMMNLINYQMPIVNSIPLLSLHQVHPDGGLSYRVPSLMSYVLRPVNMFAGSRVDVQQDGEGYGFRTMA